jgi:hypothetical protein
MAYYINLFSPSTYEAFKKSDRTISGFSIKQKSLSTRLQAGDILVCYLTKLSRWFGLLEVIEGPFTDNTPIFLPEDDPFIVRFKVRPLAVLDVAKSIPIQDQKVWKSLSFTKDLPRGSSKYSIYVRVSLRKLDDADGEALARLIRDQDTTPTAYPLDEKQYARLLTKRSVRREDKIVQVSVPDEAISEEEDKAAPPSEVRESIRIQAMLGEIGTKMKFSIWIPKQDRERVFTQWPNGADNIIERLPLNYDDTTLSTIEQIDVIWLKGRRIIRVFEVEHTTSIYSGILRMADLLALQPNIDIKLHIVAPIQRWERVSREIRRPVFAMLAGKPLAEVCTYLSYDAVQEIFNLGHLPYLSDNVLEEYEEEAE